MGRRKNGVGTGKKRNQVGARVLQEPLDYHEGLSSNQVKIILREFGLDDKFKHFSEWICGQTCPVVERHSRDTGELVQKGGVYEYDLFRWIDNQRKGTPLVWD